MGAVFSIGIFPFRMVERVMGAGVAVVVASAFYPFNRHYLCGLAAILPLCEPADPEPFEDFSVVLSGLCDERDGGTSKPAGSAARTQLLTAFQGSNAKPSPPDCSRYRVFRTRTAPQCAVWKSPTVAAKKLYRAAAAHAQQRAARFHRRYRLYGPPDWTDPALTLLPASCLYPPTAASNVFPSLFPFAAPHIVVSAPRDCTRDAAALTACANGVQWQDQAFGNRLVVADPPSWSGPRPVIFNCAPIRRRPGQAPPQEADTRVSHRTGTADEDLLPSLTADEDDGGSTSGPSECDTIGDCTALACAAASCANTARRDAEHTFWIDEDEDELPEIPASWAHSKIPT